MVLFSDPGSKSGLYLIATDVLELSGITSETQTCCECAL